jgi:5-methylcytosine-specific restriction endonuclease McrA
MQSPAERRELQRIRQRDYYRKNHDAVRQRAKAGYERNRDEVKAQARAYYAKHAAERRAYALAYRRAHPELKAASDRRYVDGHREKARHNNLMHRSRRAGNGGSHTVQEWLDKVALLGNCCIYCGRDDLPLSRDHNIPVVRGGSSDISNILPACRRCNSAKKDRTAVEYLAALAQLREEGWRALGESGKRAAAVK